MQTFRWGHPNSNFQPIFRPLQHLLSRGVGLSREPAEGQPRGLSREPAEGQPRGLSREPADGQSRERNTCCSKILFSWGMERSPGRREPAQLLDAAFEKYFSVSCRSLSLPFSLLIFSIGVLHCSRLMRPSLPPFFCVSLSLACKGVK